MIDPAGNGLSVLTLVKGRRHHLSQLIEGLTRCARSPDELVIVDLDEFALLQPTADFPIRVIHLPHAGLPLAKARNRAAQDARFSRLMFLDVDCIPMRDLTENFDSSLREHDALICADVRYLADGEARLPWDEASLLQTAVSHPVRRFPLQGLRPESNAGLFWSLVFGIRRDRFLSLSGFDERFTGYGAEDTDFGFRAQRAGLPLQFMGGAGVFHQHHAIFDPPLQHFDDILRNAIIFHTQWNTWPMVGWLTAFEQAGLIHWQGNRLQRLRSPSAEEIAAARQPSHVRF